MSGLEETVREHRQEIVRLRGQRDALLEALRMMRRKYGEYACSVCDRADAAIVAVENAVKRSKE